MQRGEVAGCMGGRRGKSQATGRIPSMSSFWERTLVVPRVEGRHGREPGVSLGRRKCSKAEWCGWWPNSASLLRIVGSPNIDEFYGM